LATGTCNVRECEREGDACVREIEREKQSERASEIERERERERGVHVST
jgi:hypothetical protein